MNDNTIAKNLNEIAKLIAKAIQTPEKIKKVAEITEGFEISNIDFQGAPNQVWYNLLKYANDRTTNRVCELVQNAFDEDNSNKHLVEALNKAEMLFGNARSISQKKNILYFASSLNKSGEFFIAEDIIYIKNGKKIGHFPEQLTTEQWEERLRKVTSEFVPTKIQSIKQVEAIFSCIARKLEFSTLDREHDDLYKTIFQQQMQLLTKKYDNGWYGPQTRRDSTNRDLGSRCIGDFWLWGLSDLISEEMIPAKAKDLFPMYKKLDSSWVRTLENTTSIESPTSDIFGNKPKKLEEDQCKSYRRLVDISFLLIPQINITTEDINLSLLLCPAYMIHSFLDNKKPDATMFIKKHHGFSVDSCILWYEPIIYLAKKHASNNLSAVATYLLQEIINIQSQQPHQRSILTIAQKLHRHYQDLFTFLLDHASIDDCEYPSTAIANYEEYKYLNSTPASWKNWYLDHIVGNIEKKESLITYIRTTDRKVEIESRYWLLIFDQDDENPISVRKIWENSPEIALSKAIQLLNEGSRHTKVWFSEVSDQQIYFLCEKVLEYMGTKNIALPDWFKTWYERNLQRDNSIEVLHDNLFQDRR